MENSTVNTLGIILLVAVCLVILRLKYISSGEHVFYRTHTRDRFCFPELISFVKHEIHELSRNPVNEWGMSEDAWMRKVKIRAELRQALRGCTSGDQQDKQYVKSYIRDLLMKGYGITEENIGRIIPFQDRERLTARDRFDIVLYLYELRHGCMALSALIEDYGLDQHKELSGEEEAGTGIYEINSDDVDMVFYREYRLLSFTEKLDLVVQRVYQMYKGFSVIDTIREQNIDGVSGGVSGIPGNSSIWQQMEEPGETGGQEIALDQDGRELSRSWDSVWIFYKGKSLRLSFLSFGSEAELKRVCQNIYKFNLPGQLSEANGFKVNEMKDGSRVVVVRPPFAETWAFFIRKFDVKSAVLEGLIQGRNAGLPVMLLKYLMKGSRITSITGSQGSGKTTLLMAMVKHIYPSYTLRVQEMSFELHLRRLYSARNILTFRETEYVSGQAGLDLQKKTDGTVNILGEVATDEVAAWMVQMAQVASLFTLFTHHAKTFRDLIESLRNSLLKVGMFRDEKIAEQQVASVIDFDIHLCKDPSGNRYIERITECYRLDEGYRERVIVEYRNGAYVPVEPVSSRSVNEMIRDMTPGDAANFEKFLGVNWREAIGA
ncbi:pilus assembly protein CpaF [Fontibacillus phaseoli]|uniref:Pilus assembly protein CpaF n=1 Tax=Fontibacillus phaseoli TaxID=1416533 RepID=A0A369BPR3_9BACL|nr:ATPase, T2SS/T4P/T4SS family [Fontibacillus phaseoli]RCX23533.1 pilus assembly protein CpaF [Fontibacillus phaseoli]